MREFAQGFKTTGKALTDLAGCRWRLWCDGVRLLLRWAGMSLVGRNVSRAIQVDLVELTYIQHGFGIRLL